MLVGQSEPGCDALVCAEQPLDEIRAVAFLAAMQQHDVIRESVCSVEKFSDGGEGLEIGKVAPTSGDAAL